MWNNAGRFVQPQMPPITQPAITQPLTADDFDTQDDDSQLPLQTIRPPELLEITRRVAEWGVERQMCGQKQTICSTSQLVLPRKIHNLQRFYATYIKRIVGSAEISMWRVFCSVRRETRVVQNAVLTAVRPMADPGVLQRWPKNRRQIDNLIASAGGFRGRVMRSVKIDLREHDAGLFSFRFLDPIYAWAKTACEVSKDQELYFQFCPRYCPSTQQRLYGTSVRCGEVMRKACEVVQTRFVNLE